MDLVPLDEKRQLFISPSIDDWKSIEDHGITAVIDLDGDLDLGIPNIPNHMLYVYFPIFDEGLPNLNKLHALAKLGAQLVANGEKVLVHCGTEYGSLPPDQAPARQAAARQAAARDRLARR